MTVRIGTALTAGPGEPGSMATRWIGVPPPHAHDWVPMGELRWCRTCGTVQHYPPEEGYST